MKRICSGKVIVSVSILLILFLIPFIYDDKAALEFNVKRISYSNQKLINEYFKINIPNSAVIEKCDIESDSSFDCKVEYSSRR